MGDLREDPAPEHEEMHELLTVVKRALSEQLLTLIEDAKWTHLGEHTVEILTRTGNKYVLTLEYRDRPVPYRAVAIEETARLLAAKHEQSLDLLAPFDGGTRYEGRRWTEADNLDVVACPWCSDYRHEVGDRIVVDHNSIDVFHWRCFGESKTAERWVARLNNPNGCDYQAGQAVCILDSGHDEAHRLMDPFAVSWKVREYVVQNTREK